MLLCCSLRTFPWWSFRWVFAPPRLLARVREADDVVGPDRWRGSRGSELVEGGGRQPGGTATDGRAGTASPGAAPAVWSLLRNTLTFIRSFSQIYFFSFHHLLYPLCCPLNFYGFLRIIHNLITALCRFSSLFSSPARFSVIVVTSVNHSRRSHLPVSHNPFISESVLLLYSNS